MRSFEYIGGVPWCCVYDNMKTVVIGRDEKGLPINHEVLPFIGKPSEIKGIVEKMEDWYILKINSNNINILSNKSAIY